MINSFNEQATMKADWQAGNKSGGATARRKGGARRLSALTRKLVSPALRRQGFAEVDIITGWRRIVGADVAARSLPLKLAFQRGSNMGATLHVRVAGNFALELQHMTPQILERINAYYGYRAVTRLSLTQGPVPGAENPSKGQPPALDAAQQAELEGLVGDKGKADKSPLRKALLALGRAVFSSQADDQH